MDLLIGCGATRDRRINPERGWIDLVTLDINPAHRPDVVHDLEILPLPFEDNQFAEIQAYEVLEHTGAQGDWRFFFDQFTEFWRILEPGGLFAASVPAWNSIWAWGDPSHKRVINEGTLVFLSQAAYVEQVGKTAMSDFRSYYRADFTELTYQYVGDAQFYFTMRAKK